MKTKKRIRWTLLVLLWMWAIVIFMTLDLFTNVEEFDDIRPRANLYRGMRVAAHKMVGERLPTGSSVKIVVVHTLGDELEAVRTMTASEDLRHRARTADDSRVRIAALRELARRFQDRDTLLRVVRDDSEEPRVRRHAARFLGWTGSNADRDLENVLASDGPAAVRGGAVLGLGELGNEAATERLLVYATGKEFHDEALRAIAGIRNVRAAPLLCAAALEPERATETRTASCRALWTMNEPATVRALSTVLGDARNPPELRAMAADSLGRLRAFDARTVIATAKLDPNPDVARKARLASTRLRRAK